MYGNQRFKADLEFLQTPNAYADLNADERDDLEAARKAASRTNVLTGIPTIASQIVSRLVEAVNERRADAQRQAHRVR